MIQSKAMLVDLTISQWTATKHDKAVSAEVETAHAAKDAGRYNKRLIDKAHLAEINRIANELRKHHYSRTLPWTDKGQRLLPSELFLDYRQDMAKYKADFQAAVSTFIKLYPQLVQDARMRLGTMYQAEDYPQPTDLSALFDITVEFAPVPDANDFRVDVSKETQDEIRQQITDAVSLRQAKMVKECWARMREVVGRIAEQCGKENGVIRDSLIDNARDLVNILGGLNVTANPTIATIEVAIRSKLIVPAAQLRTSPTVRAEVARVAHALLERMPQE